VVTKKRKGDEDQIFPESQGTVDDGASGSSRIKTDSKSPTRGNANNPFMICDDSDSDVEVLIMEDTVRLAPADESEVKEAQDGNNVDVHHNVAPSSRDPPLPEELPKDDLERKENPFSKFAFAAGGGSEAIQPPRPSLLWRSSNVTATGKPTPSVSAKRSNDATLSKAIKPGLASSNMKGKKKSCEFVTMRSIPKEEQDKITRKWHSLADPSAPLQVRRFQVLLAARLHARCQEPSVRKAMSVLRSAFADLTVSAVAQADPEVLALHITNLQYYNSKAQQIVKAAKEIETEFHGIVPEDETSLLRLTGVGKVFADLLAFVNTHEIHERFETGAQAVVGITGNEEKQAEVASDAVEP
jgi:hypothetical protein